MRISDNAQERLEMLWMVSEEGVHDDAEGAETTQTADIELENLGLIHRDDGAVSLTSNGKSEAAMAIRRHRLAERLLTDVLVTEEAILDERAGGQKPAIWSLSEW